MIGTSLAHFRITAKLGEGGMGEVYRAEDTRLGREVAIKVLPGRFAADPERLARFEREARALASLSHSNIAGIFEVGEADGRHFLAMELAPGETLAERIARGPLPLPEALAIALQIAHALEAAHRAGIIHRDLKPANVMVDGAGQVKVLDFGLAKALEPAPGSSPGLELTYSPTITYQPTQVGVLLGTAAYMSPEQAKGKPADKRADIWAFGVVLWEMLSGRQLFAEASISETLAAVLKTDPDLAALPPVPPGLRRLVDRCLRKDPNDRLHDAADVRIALEDALRGPDRAGDAAPAAASRGVARRSVLWPSLLGLAVAIGLAAGWFAGARRSAGPEPRALRFSVQPPPGVGYVTNPVLAEDGSFLVYRGWSEDGGRLYLHAFDQFSSRALPGTEGAEWHFLSPDGRWVGFARGDDLFKVATAGGDVLGLGAGLGSGPGATWGPGDRIVVSTAWLGGLAEIGAEGAAGGAPRPVSTPDAGQGETGHWWPRFLPGGRSVLFTVWPAGAGLNDARIAVLDLASGRHRSLLPGAQASYLASGHLVYYRAGAYHAVAFDLDSLAVRGQPVRLTDEPRELMPQGEDRHSLAVSPGGVLAFMPGTLVPPSALAWVVPGAEPEKLPLPARSYHSLRLSPDGRRAAVAALEAGRHVLRLVDLERGTEGLLEMPGSNWSPIWHPAGDRLAFLTLRKGDFDVYWRDLPEGTPEEPLLEADSDESPHDFSSSGSHLVFEESTAGGRYEVRTLELAASGERQSLFPAEAEVAISPDERWLAYGDEQVSVRPFLRPGATIRVSRGHGTSPVWSRTESLLLYRRGDEIVAAPYREEGGRLVVGDERLVARVPGIARSPRTFDLAPDGRILALVQVDPDAKPELRVVLGWDREVTALAPPDPER